MDRSKRTPKTPKRFDDEAFITPPRVREHQQPKQPAQPVVEKAKPPPEVDIKPPRSIIKVKLTKRDSTRPTKLDTSATEPTPTKSKESVSITEPAEPAIKIKEEVIDGPPAKQIKQEKPAKREYHRHKDTSKTKEVTSSKKEVVKQKETVKQKEVAKHKEPNKLITPKFEPKTPDREVQINFRPRTKRPRTPPVYADLIPNVILPFWDARTAAEDHEDDNVKELVHCHCGIPEESGLMVQCETCLTWQHAHCLGFEKPEDAPDGYTCKACSDPKFARESMKWAYDQEWLTKGRMKQFPCDKTPIPERNIEVLKRINDLIGSVLKMHQILHNLRIKHKVLKEAEDDDPDLNLFRVLWPPSYQHQDGNIFIPTINNPASTPASTISVVGDTPDPGDIGVETIVDGPLPDIGHLEDVSAILDNSYKPNPPAQQMATGSDATPNECRANLKLHIQQTEEFVGMELAGIEEQLAALERECAEIKGARKIEASSLDALKDDLKTMRSYLFSNGN